ncbi:MAG: RrF2 family transcriptional regulator [Flavobacteriia bacterium]|jgi:Rrf2 family iron-sulfur cluster assembly transcriptional regulator
MFSKACEYAIRSCILIATNSLESKNSNLKDISKAIDSPEAFTAKILQKLSKNNIITSVKGPTGGFKIEEKKMTEIKLKDIVFAVDGEGIYTNCALGMKECSEVAPCPLHSQFKFIKNSLNEMLDSTDLKQLCYNYKNGLTFLKIN